MRDIQDIPEPAFASELNTVIVELEKLREKRLRGSVPAHAFWQLKDIFQALESLGSARIEGNRTTIAEYADKVIDGVSPDTDESMREIQNVDDAIKFLEQTIKPGTPITAATISEVHKILVRDLTPPESNGSGGEGSRNPGIYRNHNVRIGQSNVKTSDFQLVQIHTQDLLEFVNDDHATQYHLLVMALAHHRMAVIHPFDNGNGRLVRLLTYAQLLQQGFNVAGRILNPTAVFCDDRQQYYNMLATADDWSDSGMLTWCLYVLQGISREIEKIDNLADRQHLTKDILQPMLTRSRENRYITADEYTILRHIIDGREMNIKAGELERLLGIKEPVTRSRFINRMQEKKLLTPIEAGGRIYTIQCSGNYMFRELTQLLIEKDFVPASLTTNQ